MGSQSSHERSSEEEILPSIMNAVLGISIAAGGAVIALSVGYTPWTYPEDGRTGITVQQLIVEEKLRSRNHESICSEDASS